MKKLLLLLLVSLLMVGCGNFKPSVFTVNVTSNVPYQGQYLVAQSDGKSVSKSISSDKGTATYTAEGKTISFSVQKHSADGVIAVQVCKDGQVIKSESTKAPYGIVMITTD